ncbi:chemotaxis protein CheB [Hymenobacter nivis]|uniref:protein-glutamate methylesterase n=1 Tax=Hymenobacter nivis TaxID=1850093 RepID=A0A2Z3GQT0_9BACT|nr:chemotaxis protein CheB [Hymenobacter nivis]AWM33656.1 chemotaxis protein CheB [Hymenobacter nivis]
MALPTHLIVIGTSAGGMAALLQLVAQLPAALPAALLVVQHLPPDADPESLVMRLATHSALRCQVAGHGAPLLAGHLYLAPPDRHLLVKEDRVLVTKGPFENGYRPAADALFRAAAVAFGARVVGVVLTGMLHDGTAGLEFIKRCGGTAVVQDPAEAEFPSMPESALRNVAVDHVLPVAAMGPLLVGLVGPGHAGPAHTLGIPPDLQLEAAIAERVVGTADQVEQLGNLVPFTCPGCGGNLWDVTKGKVVRFRCHTGHSYTAAAILEGSQRKMEETLWVALRMMEERKNLLASLAARDEAYGTGRHTERLNDLKRHVNRMREFLLNEYEGENEAAATD